MAEDAKKPDGAKPGADAESPPIVDDEINEAGLGKPGLKMLYLAGGALGSMLILFALTYALLKPSSSSVAPSVSPPTLQVAQTTSSSTHAEDSHTQDLEIEVNRLKAELALANKEKNATDPSSEDLTVDDKGLTPAGDCVLTGNPETRKVELRRCLGLTKPAGAGHQQPEWQYVGEKGPEKWGQLAPEYALCGKGELQSPINIVGRLPDAPIVPHFNYKPALLSVANTGHTIQVNVEDGGGVEYNGVFYTLVQFHFHAPSEEFLDGRPTDMSLHLVHTGPDNSLLVVAVRLQRGEENKSLLPIFKSMPPLPGKEFAVPQSDIDPDNLLPSNRAFYSFAGSLTTPPCTEAVTWIVMQNTAPVSAKQYQAFTAMYPYNARPIQRTNGRLIYQHQ